MVSNEQGVTSRDNSSPKEGGSDPSKIRAVLTAAGVGFGTILLIGLWSLLPAIFYYGATGEITYQAEMVFNNIGLLLGTISIGYLFFRYTEKDLDFVDIHRPSLKHLITAILSVGVLLLFAVILEQILTVIGFPMSDHQIYDMATSPEGGLSPEFILLLIPISILIVGPAEEFVFRGLIQKSLYSNFTTKMSILLTSTIFALIHFPAYLTGTIADAIATLLVIFGLSIILGAIYAHTENVVVPALTHGIYNAVLFLFLYLEVVNTI